MKSFRLKNGYLLRLDKGEEVVDTILKFAEKMKIKSGAISAIGAVTDCVLGYFDRNRKTYLNKNFNDIYEVIALNGNITYFEQKPILHSHICIGDPHFNAFGGHLFSAVVAVTLELFITEIDTRINRGFVEEFNLNLIDSADDA